MNKLFSTIGVVFIRLVSYLPFPLLYALSDFFYFILYHLIGYRKKVVRENLRNSFPDHSEKELLIIEKKFYRCLCDIILDTTKLLSLSEKELRKRVVVKNSERFYELVAEGRKMTVTLGHYLNWEWFVFALPVYIPIKTYGIYKPLSNDVFDVMFKKMRSRLGMEMLSMNNAFRILLKNKDQQFSICLVTDQTPSNVESSYWTTFLNQPTPVFTGTERIAKQFDTTLSFVDIIRVKRGYMEFEFVMLAENLKDLPENKITELHVKYLEKKIIEKPEYWLWSHRRWKHKPNQEIKEKFKL